MGKVIDIGRFGKKVKKLAEILPEEQRQEYLEQRERAYQKIKEAYVAAGREPPGPTILSGEKQ